ncbi:MAG: histidine kinase [Eubacterium sp.]|nr:histidine kinase [Eubacterium sp.]
MSKKQTFRKQIIYIFIVTFLPLFLVNVYIFGNMKSIIDSVDRAYDGNRRITEMRGSLDNAHSSLREYLGSKDENTLNKFYVNLDRYKEFLEGMDREGALTESELREKAVYNLSASYIQTASLAVIAKKGSDIESYQNYQQLSESKYVYLTTYLNDMNNWMFYNNSDYYKELSGLAEIMEALYAIILVLTGVMDVAILLVLTKRLVNPLQKLADTAREVGEGNLDVQLVESDELNEIGVVNGAFNGMVRSLKDYIGESIRMETAVKDAELKYLQAQIDPHFLFNTLNAGAQLAMLEEADKTYKYIHKTADFFRYKIKNDGGVSSINDELRIVDDYIYILNVRFAGSIIYNKEIDPSLGNEAIPSMVLQPIVENCVKHGFHEIDREKRINISVTDEGDTVVLSVRDNGVGIDPEVARRIVSGEPVTAEMKQEKEEKGCGIGLDNVLTRLRGFYNRNDVMEITSVGPDMGTEIALLIPKSLQTVETGSEK